MAAATPIPAATSHTSLPMVADASPNPCPTVSVIICAYTEARWQDLEAAIASVLHQGTPALETVVVIDHNPKMLDRARRELTAVRAVENREERGLSGARNSGIAVARGEVFAFLDDDAVAAPDWLARTTEAYQRPGVIGVGGAVEPLWLGGRPRSFPEEFQWVVGCTYRGMPEEPMPVRNLIGANMSLRREVFEAVGLFRSGIGRVGSRPVGCEETELCIRARREIPHGIMLFEPAAKVFHRVPAERAGWRYFRARCYAEGLSKALVARFVGRADGLESERSYALRTLPRGVLRGLADVALRRDLSGLGRAVAIVTGLAVTSAGYVAGSIAVRWRARDERSEVPVPGALRPAPPVSGI